MKFCMGPLLRTHLTVSPGCCGELKILCCFGIPVVFIELLT